MIGQLVITSVERGLGSGPGFQPVLRTRGMRPAVAERLRLRSGYPHPYPFGDRRNPEVFFHRIESVAGQRLHVLARVADAGSDYSGRSNRISDLLVLDEAACRQLPAGPAFAATRFSWCRAWSSEARETDEAIGVPGVDSCDFGAADCRTWAAITGDAGWAGELAKSFIDGRNALVVARQGDDVLRLFSEALRLLPPEQRWNVTFNTCEIEPFAASWRAIRSDITRTPAKGDAKTLRFDLETIARTKSRSPDHAYATFARGEGPVPWQTKAADVPSVEIPPRPPTSGARSTGADHPTGGLTDDVGAEIRRRRRAVRLVSVGVDAHAAKKFSDIIRTTVWVVVSLVTIGMVLASVIWFVGNPQKLLAMLPRRGPHQDAGHSEVAELETQEQKNAREIQEEEKKKQKEHERNEKTKPEKEQEDRAAADAAAAAKQAREREAAELRRKQAEQAEAEKQSKQRQRDAIAEFRRLPAVVSIVPTGSIHKPDGELCEDVDFGPYPVDHLKEPAFSVAYPESRIDGAPLSLWIEPVDRHDSGTPAWRVLSDVPRKFGISDDETERQHICSLVADGGRLWLKWQAGVTASYPGVRLLQNSVLIATCRHPENRTMHEQEIRLAEPVLCPLVRHGPLDDRQTDFELDFGDRLQDVPGDAVRWTIDVTHPALDGPRSFHQSNEHMEVTLPRQAAVLVPSAGDVDEASCKVEIVVQLQFRVHQGVVSGTSYVRSQKPDWVDNLLTFDRLRKFYAGEGGEFREAYAKILRHQYRESTDLINSLFLEFKKSDEKYDKRFRSLEEFHSHGQRAQMRLVDADKIPWQTEKQRELRYNAMQQASQKIAEFQEISDAWDIWRNKRIDLEIRSLVETCAESLRAAKDELQAPIEIRVTRVTVEARDPADQSRGYTVEIVKPENDVTRAASK